MPVDDYDEGFQYLFARLVEEQTELIEAVETMNHHPLVVKAKLAAGNKKTTGRSTRRRKRT